MKSPLCIFFLLLLFSCSSNTGNQYGSSGMQVTLTFINTLDDYPVQIFTEDDSGNEKYIETIGANTEFEFAAAEPSQIFYFKPKGKSNYEILPYTVDTLKTQRYELELAQKRYGESKNTYKRITNAMANRYSFDIAKIDPFKIDADESRGGGRKKLIFEELSDFDRDWYPFDGDFAVKKQFDVQFINEGKSVEKSELYRSMQSFQKEYTASIDASATYKGVTGTASGSWSKLTRNGEDTQSFFSWFRKEDKKYFIQLNHKHIKLDEGFQKAVAALPVPGELPATINEAITHKTFDSYYQFVKDWGTHYPEKVTYGGIIQGSLNSTRDQITELVQKGYGVKAGLEVPIKGAEAGIGGGYSEEQIEELESITESSHKEYVYKGGEGYFELWAVGDEVQPIYIDLEPLADLLVADYLPEAEQLVAKRQMMQFAIDHYLQEFPIPSPEENNLIAYEMICSGVKFTACEDADKPYNALDRVRVSMWPGLDQKMLKIGTRYLFNTNGVVWEVKKGSKVVTIPEASRKKYKETKSLSLWKTPLQKPKMVFLLDPKKISKAERNRVKIRFYARFDEDDGWDAKDEEAYGGTYSGIALKDVGKSFKHYTLKVKEPKKDWDKSKLNAEVYYKIRKFDLFE
ncbi:MAG: MAC/perforin domain-containing protein [Bacteroidota bacterium]